VTEAVDARSTVALILEEQRRLDIYLGRRMVAVPPATRVLMIAPHPDDNLFGPGGTALKYVAAGIPVHWITLTDGRACTPRAADRRALAEVRAREERRCAELMGIEEPVLLDIPEDELTSEIGSRAAVDGIVTELRRLRPDAIYVPYFLEVHPLHRYTTHLCARALLEERNPGTIYSWAHGSLVPPSVVVDITAEFPRKEQLAECYTSQLAGRDWPTELRLLGRLQASFALDGAEFCETFLAQDDASFIPDVLQRGLDRPETLGAGIQPVVPQVD
jgi:LmbE family N-acetylglucosaminyl deacetylase